MRKSRYYFRILEKNKTKKNKNISSIFGSLVFFFFHSFFFFVFEGKENGVYCSPQICNSISFLFFAFLPSLPDGFSRKLPLITEAKRDIPCYLSHSPPFLSIESLTIRGSFHVRCNKFPKFEEIQIISEEFPWNGDSFGRKRILLLRQ